MICKIHSGSQEAHDASAAPGATESQVVRDEEYMQLERKSDQIYLLDLA